MVKINKVLKENMGEVTQQNLAKVFLGESQANRKYLAFLRKAEEKAIVRL